MFATENIATRVNEFIGAVETPPPPNMSEEEESDVSVINSPTDDSPAPSEIRKRPRPTTVPEVDPLQKNLQPTRVKNNVTPKSSTDNEFQEYVKATYSIREVSDGLSRSTTPFLVSCTTKMVTADNLFTVLDEPFAKEKDTCMIYK